MAIPRHHSEALTVEELTDRCNQDENNLTAKLQSLAATKDEAGTDVTEGKYKEQDNFDDLGNLTIEEYSSGKEAAAEFVGSAFIHSVKTKVLVFRS